MEAITKNKGTLAAAVLLILAMFLYNAYMPDGAGSEAPSALNVGADLLKISENISRATLSQDLFSASAYRLLSDFSTPLVPQPTGRLNPFAPIGRE